MKNSFKTAVLGTALVATLIAAPLASFAKENNNNGNGKALGHAKQQVHLDQKIHSDLRQNPKSSLLWSQFLSWLNTNHINQNGSSSNSGTTTTPGNLPPVISGISSPTTLNVGQAGTWSVTASDPQNGSLSYAVTWGDEGNGFARPSDSQQSFTQTATFSHTYSKAGIYTVTFTVRDSAGLTTKSSITVNITGTAPVISNLVASSTRAHQATVAWNTDIRSDSKVWFSTSSAINTSAAPNVSRSDLTTNHKIILNNLQPSTTYYVIVGSATRSGVPTISSETSFMTPAENTGATVPVISSITSPTTVIAGQSATWTVNASDPRNSSLSYSVDWGDTGLVPRMFGFFNQASFTQTAMFDHTYASTGTYTATFTAKNSSGQMTSSSVTVNVVAASTTPDTTPPAITNITAAPGASTSTIAWTTDELSTSKVFYSTTTTVDTGTSTTSVISDGSLVTSHSLTLSNLATSTTYYFKVQSADASNNVQTSGEFSFVTASGL